MSSTWVASDAAIRRRGRAVRTEWPITTDKDLADDAAVDLLQRSVIFRISCGFSNSIRYDIRQSTLALNGNIDGRTFGLFALITPGRMFPGRTGESKVSEALGEEHV